MENYEMADDIRVFYVSADSFPAGIKPAFNRLHELVPFSPDRKMFGLSRMENGSIAYKAAVEELEAGEAEKFGCPVLTVKKGLYRANLIINYMDNIQDIGITFQEMIKHPDIDPEGYCVECYLSQKEVRCMVRLKD